MLFSFSLVAPLCAGRQMSKFTWKRMGWANRFSISSSCVKFMSHVPPACDGTLKTLHYRSSSAIYNIKFPSRDKAEYFKLTFPIPDFLDQSSLPEKFILFRKLDSSSRYDMFSVIFNFSNLSQSSCILLLFLWNLFGF